jgi:ATP-dependent protease ClpP protease subunit
MQQINYTPCAARVHTSAVFASGGGLPEERTWNVALRALADEEIEIVVYDVIGKDFWGDGSAVGAKDVIAKLRSTPKAKKITLRVNSVGGVVDEAKAMVNLLAERAAGGVKIEAFVDGLAASAASYLLTAATRVVMPANAFMMIHGVRGGKWGTADEMEAAAALFRRLNDQIADGYAEASARRGKGKTKAEFLKAFDDGDLYLDADQAIEWGLADEKLAAVKAAACLADIERLTAAPEALRAAPYVQLCAEPAPQPEPPKPSAGPDARQLNQLPAIGNGDPQMKMISLVAIAAVLGFTAEQTEKAEEKDILDAAGKLKLRAETPPPAAVNVSGVKLVGVATEAEATAKIQDFQRTILQLLGTTGKATPAEAISAVLDWKSGAEQTVNLTKRVGELTEESRVAKRDGAIEKMSREGILPPARHEWARSQFATADAVESFCAGMPQGFFNSIKTPEDGEAVSALTAEEKQVCAVLGMTEEKYLEEKKLLRKAG